MNYITDTQEYKLAVTKQKIGNQWQIVVQRYIQGLDTQTLELYLTDKEYEILKTVLGD